jgi:hypothetical protein
MLRYRIQTDRYTAGAHVIRFRFPINGASEGDPRKELISGMSLRTETIFPDSYVFDFDCADAATTKASGNERNQNRRIGASCEGLTLLLVLSFETQYMNETCIQH